jgi:hypothetical protein
MPVYKSIWHYTAAHIRNGLQKFFQLGLRDCMNHKLQAGDRVFDLDYHFNGRTSHDAANLGTIFTDTTSVTGLSIEWDNGELSPLADPSHLLKKSV